MKAFLTLAVAGGVTTASAPNAHADGALTVNRAWAGNAQSHDVQQMGRGDGIQYPALVTNSGSTPEQAHFHTLFQGEW